MEANLKLCDYSHDFDGAVYEEKSCCCHLYRDGDNYFIRRRFTEEWDQETKRDYTEDIPVQKDDLHMGIKKFCATYCNGRTDNSWIDTYKIHRDADAPEQKTVWQMILEND